MMMDGGGGMAWLVVFGLAVWIGLIGLGGWALGRYLSTRQPQVPRPAARETPLEILERRYADGSIDAADFDEARARIREDEAHR